MSEAFTELSCAIFSNSNPRYKFDLKDFQKFIKWDKYKYTRNLVHEGNSKFNLILMCWPEAVSSAIHDHQVRDHVSLR